MPYKEEIETLESFTPVDFLENAKRILKTQDHWSKGQMARTLFGQGCPAKSPEAYQFCLIGTLHVQYLELEETNSWAAYFGVNKACLVLDSLAETHYPERIQRGSRPAASFNDHPDTTFEEVVGLIDLAIVELSRETKVLCGD